MRQSKPQRHLPTPRAAWVLAAAALALPGCATAAARQGGAPASMAREEASATLVRGREQFEAVATARQDRMEFQLAPGERRQLTLSPELAARLGALPERSFAVLAVQQATPGGLLSAARLKDDRGLYALAEIIRDVPTLTPDERGGLGVEQLPAAERTPLYEDECATVYNVPTRFTFDGRQEVLQAHESRAVEWQGATYTLSLEESRFVVPKPNCSIPLEGGQSRVGYTLVRR